MSRPELLVFADDWGRHPSSAQHLVRRLLDDVAVTWVNTTGTRKPRLTAGDLRRAWEKLTRKAPPQSAAGFGPRVVAPVMYPGFRSTWQRRINTWALTRALKPTDSNSWAAVLTTLPITADLVGRLPATRWVYYCVDDFSQWPGTDHAVMDVMERELVAKADAVIAVSETLRDRLRSMGRDDVTLLTHGVDLEHWASAGDRPGNGRTLLFWGLIDPRLDVAWCRAAASTGDLRLVGPVQDAPVDLPGTRTGPTAYAELPGVAAEADVLVMPYIDAPVTRAMQPLKLKEYLATYKPVVVRDLPATRDWADCCDVVDTAEAFARVCAARANTGLPADQRTARERRLPGESWSEKARALRAVLADRSMGRSAGGVRPRLPAHTDTGADAPRQP